jgi:hypothetical protein
MIPTASHCLPRFFLILGDVSDEIGGDAFGVGLKLVDELGIPEVMKCHCLVFNRAPSILASRTVR